MPITVRGKQDADAVNYPEITSVASAFLAEDNTEVCSSFIMSGGIQDGKEDEKRWKHQAKRQKQPQPKNIRFSKRIKRLSLMNKRPIRRALFFIDRERRTKIGGRRGKVSVINNLPESNSIKSSHRFPSRSLSFILTASNYSR